MILYISLDLGIPKPLPSLPLIRECVDLTLTIHAEVLRFHEEQRE